jgi:queuine tRNA-ribosyltransferase
VRFDLVAGAGTAPRAGLLQLAHGVVATPAFMPVATRGTVKALDMADVAELDPSMLLMNAYHLWLAPGSGAVEAAGGLHRFTGWPGNILTDSGGYQAVSLARAGMAEVGEEGVAFDTGIERRVLSPEVAVQVQEELGADVMMALDQPVGYPVTADDALIATERTHRWAARCLTAWRRRGGELLGIVQGGFDPELRRESARVIGAMDFPGFGIGGLSLGEPAALGEQLLLATTEVLDPARPRYLMGVGSEPEMLRAVAAGVDLFDCVWPTRLARTGTVLVGSGRINLNNRRHAEDPAPIEEGCACAACRGYGRAGLRLLHRRGTLLGHRLCTIHNLHHTLELLRLARRAIVEGRFAEFAEARLGRAVG